MKNFYTLIWTWAVLLTLVAFVGPPSQLASPVKPKTEVDSMRRKAESFAGVITYDVLVESKSPLFSSQKLQNMYGTTMRMFIGSGQYKLAFDGDSSIEVIYRDDENRQYVLSGTSDSILWRTAADYDSKSIATRSTDKAVIVMGRNCDSYSIETDWGAISYFYDPAIYLDPDPYRGHGFNYFNVYLRHSKSPYLKYLYDGPSMKMTFTARDIEQRQVDPAVFEPLPLPLASTDISPMCNLNEK